MVHPAEGSFDLSGYENVVDAIIGIIIRHPMRQDELERTLTRWSPGQVIEALADLEAGGRAQIVERHGTCFWSAAPAYYPDKAQSERTNPDHNEEVTMSTDKHNKRKILDDVHPFLEKMLIETYLKGKGYILEELKSLPEEEAKQLMKEASTYASGKLAEVEVKAHLMQELHDAYIGE